MKSKECWSCGHYLIGGGCWKDGQMGEDGWRDVLPSDSCAEWVTEKTPGTINGGIWAHIDEDKEEKVREYYELLSGGTWEQDVVANTLDLLGIKIEGVNG